MLLVITITRTQLANYRKELIQCLEHNAENKYIEQIYLFTDDIDHNIKCRKTKIIFRRNLPSRGELILECKKTSIFNKIIISEPFIQFQEDLYKIVDEDLQKNVFENSNYIIFSKNVKMLEIKHINLSTKKINIQKETISENLNSNRNLLVKKSIFDPNKINPTLREKKLDVIIVSINYNDYLLISLVNNIKVFDNITVVTTKDDIKCQEICKNLGVNCVISERVYDDGAKFNKGKAINDGIKSLDNPDLILLLDSDIVVKEKIELDRLSDDVLYTSNRIIYKDYNSFISECNEIEEIDKGWGFFQLFCFNNPVIDKNCPFPELSETADGSDLVFRDYFERRRSINKKVIHLGDTKQNWKGRVTEKFITDEQLQKLINETKFEINKYFDNIYCLNLDKRQDRWEKVSKQFNRFNINVERWSAIDGHFLDSKLLEYYNPDGLKGEEASILGIPENKNAIGCLLSHLEIIKNAKENNYQRILIFEDDILLSNEFDKEVNKLFKLDWKLAYLGASQFDWSEIKIENNFYKSKKTLSTFAYAVESSIFDDILNIKSIKSIDNLLSELQIKFYGDCFTFYPNIVVSDVNKSDIREEKEMSSYSKMMRWELDKFTFINNSKSIIKKKEALDNLIELDKLFRELNVEYWLTCGTLLGFYRDNDFISHDKDTDICVNSEHFNGYVLKRILSKGFKILKCFGELEDGFEISFFRNGVKIDIFLFYKNEDKWYNSVYADFTSVDCLKFDYVYEPFEISENIFLGYSFKTPKNIEHFLKQQYGDNFKTPIKNWSYFESPKNLLKTKIRLPYPNVELLKSFNKNIYLDNLTILIKSFLRKECVDRLINSIRNYYKNIKIIIVDDSGDPNTYNFDYDNNIKTYNLEFDGGLSFGRNFGVSVIETEFFLLLDDDFEFTKNTNLIKFMDIMIESDLDILGADVIVDDKKLEYFYNLKLEGDSLYYINEKYEIKDNYQTCDLILNFFIARTNSIKKHKWLDELKLSEHTAFFFEHKTKIKVGHTDKISIDHQRLRTVDYDKYRNRSMSFLKNWMDSKSIKSLIDDKKTISIINDKINIKYNDK